MDKQKDLKPKRSSSKMKEKGERKNMTKAAATAKVQKLVETLITKTKVLLQDEETGHLNSETLTLRVDEVAKDIQKNAKIKDIDSASKELMERSLELYKRQETEAYLDRQALRVYNLGKDILDRAKILRQESNRQAQYMIDTNLLQHAPFFAGGKRKQKTDETAIVLDKNGLKRLTYHNQRGKLLSLFDAKVLFGMFKIWEESGRPDWFEFTKYNLLDAINMGGPGGRQYEMIEESIKNLFATTVVLKEFYEKEKGRVIETDQFHLIMAQKDIINAQEDGTILSQVYRIQFSPYLRQSLSNGYYSLISLAVLDELQSGSSQGLYLMLSSLNDKDQYYNPEGYYEFPLKLVYNHLYLVDADAKNKAAIKQACDDLVATDILSNWCFVGSGRKVDSVRLTPSAWFNKLSTLAENNQNIEGGTDTVLRLAT